jgi:hypothetical protein
MSSATHRAPNALINATSPYLLQHAYNPVAWQEWGPGALQQAVQEDKPILISIGYSSCHWCHVMERESFEDEDLAALMNAYFICIKVDREERPDLDQVYMEAVQAMGINGGWPLNVFLTPQQKPFYGGTYFPPKAWANVLTQIRQAFVQRRSEIDASADRLTEHLKTTDNHYIQHREGQSSAAQQREQAYDHLKSRFDSIWGGLDKAPKFFMPSIWLWLLRYHYLHQTQEEALHQVTHTLSRIRQGGIHDHLGGGFARYSVDGQWFAPHFEKMLYDNAQLLSLYAEGYQVTGDASFKQTAQGILQWLTQEMTHPQGGFFSALDADSEGMEGKFYTWTHEELTSLLGANAKDFCAYYQVTSEGNWEHGLNLLHVAHSSIPPDRLEEMHHLLVTVRNKRPKPGLDDKILTGWNAMTVCGLVDAYHAFGDPAYARAAGGCLSFVMDHLVNHTQVYRSWKGRPSTTSGFLEDYAYLIHALIKMYEADFVETRLLTASRLMERTLNHFFDDTQGYFWYTSDESENLITRKKELFDNVIPSSNSVMAMNLFVLGTYFDRDDWKEKARHMVNGLQHLITKEPAYMSHWAMAAAFVHVPLVEVAFTGPRAVEYKTEFKRTYAPYCLVMGTSGNSSLPLLRDKQPTDQTTVYVCANKVCHRPVSTVADALEQVHQLMQQTKEFDS